MSDKSSGLLLKVVAFLVAVAAGVALFVYFSRPTAKTVVVAKGNAAHVVPGSVVVDAERTSAIASEIEGKLAQTALVVGQVVKEGDVVAQIDSADVDIEISQVRSDLEAARKGAAIAQTVAELNQKSKKEELEAAERDFTRSAMSVLEIERRRREFKIAEQARDKAAADDVLRVATLENTLKVAERKKEKMTIRAPFDGTITEVLARKNDLVGAKQPIANLIALSRLVRAKISEENFAAVREGNKADVSLLGYPGQKFKATITQKLPTAEAETQRYIAYLKLEIAPEKLVPNLTGEIGITIDEHRDVMIVPRRALLDGARVYLIEGGRAVERQLEVGFVDFNFAEVKQGLRVGDRVIVEELEKFRDGQRVRTEASK